jgi:hypothetical protein
MFEMEVEILISNYPDRAVSLRDAVFG